MEKESLEFIFHDYEIEFGDTKGRNPGESSYSIPLSESTRKSGGTGSPSDLSLQQIPQAIADQKELVETMRDKMAARAALDLVTGNFSGLTEMVWQPERERLKTAQSRVYRLEMEPQRRWANGFSCLSFVAVGAPWAVMRRNADMMTNFFICFMPILLIYYPFLMFSTDLAKSGSIPSATVWIGNLLLIAIGWSLYKRVRQY